MTTTQVSIYALINPIDDSVFYVGCTSKPWDRLSQHVTESRQNNTPKSRIIKEIKSSGHDVEMLVLDKCEISDSSFWEEFYIELFRSFGFDLPQWSTSTYSETYRCKKFFLERNTGMSLNLPNNIYQDIRRISHAVCIERDSLLKMAMVDFIDKYRDCIDEGATKEQIASVKRELKRRHSCFINESRWMNNFQY